MLKKEINNIVKNNDLKHIAIIMDGNRRWAKDKNLPTAVGHKKGVDSLRTIVRACDTFGIKHLTVYAFSTENWSRKQEEVNFLMELVVATLKNELEDMHRENVKIEFIGEREGLPENLRKIITNAENKTQNNIGVNLHIALNYGSRSEIINAVKNIIKDNVCASNIDAKLISNYLYTKEVPDPDILIRTGAEKRISNYLLWQIAYSEIIFRDEYWPDFDEQCLEMCIQEFGKRQRRYGK